MFVVSLQQKAKNPETFSPSVISLPPELYSSMTKAFHLPYKAIESSGCVGPLFWAAVEDEDKENPYLRPYYPSLLRQYIRTNRTQKSYTAKQTYKKRELREAGKYF